MPTLLNRAYAEMLGLAMAVRAKDERSLDEALKGMLAIAPAEAKPEEKPAKEKPKEEKKEEELAGLGALFG